MRVLGIETSCDETSCAIVTAERRILSNKVWSQVTEHAIYGGVVPEIAARSHIRHLPAMMEEAVAEADLALEEVDAIAVTSGPGLIGGLIVGVMAAKGMAYALNKPLVAVNHLEGHALTARLTDDVPFPYLLLLVSGGHCQLLTVEGVGRYRKLGGTLDDAVGEAFDKAAKLLSLGYPGGPAVEKAARWGNASRFTFPLPLKGQEGCDFSFSGLKTAMRMKAEALHAAGQLDNQAVADLCAAFQHTIGLSLAERLGRAIGIFKEHHPAGQHVVLAGGVAANQYLRSLLADTVARHGLTLTVPPPALCTDNAAMIAWAGLERFRSGAADGLNIAPQARWPLESLIPA